MHGGDVFGGNHFAQVHRVFMPAWARHYQPCAGKQRPEELPHRHVKTERGFLQHGVLRRKPISVLHPQQAIDHTGMVVDHAFGLAGGAGGVDYIGAHTLDAEVVDGLMLPGRLVQIDHCHLAQQATCSRLGQHHCRRAVLHHVGNAFVGIGRIQRHIRRASLENRIQADDHLQASLDADRHARIRLYAQRLQVTGQLIGLRVQLGIGQVLLARLDRHRVRRARHLRLEHPVQGLLKVVTDGGGVEIEQQLLTLTFTHQRHMLQHRLVVIDHGLQHAGEVAGITLHGRFIKKCHGIFQRTENAALHFAEVQRQVELGKVAVLDDAFQGQITQREDRRAAVLPGQQRLEHRAMGQAAQRPGDFHHLLERQVLVGLGVQRERLDPRQQRLGAQLARRVDAHRQGVDEQADQPFDFAAIAVGHRRADHHIVLPGQPRQQRGPGTHQGHVQRGAVPLAQGLEPGGEAFIQAHCDTAAGIVLLRRARAVGGQREQGRRTGQGLLPITALALQHFTTEPQALPHGKVAVLNG